MCSANYEDRTMAWRSWHANASGGVRRSLVGWWLAGSNAVSLRLFLPNWDRLFSIRSLSCDRSHDKWSMQSCCITFLTTVPLDDVTTSSSCRDVHSVGINHRLFLVSTVGSFVDQPSTRSPVTESTIERTNTRDVGVRRSSAGDEHLQEDHEAMELESWFVLRTTEQLSVFLPCYLKEKYKRWPSIRPPCAECPRDAPRLCTTCTNMHGDETLLLLKTRPATERVLVIHQNRKR
jgi:hypothetical protein